MAKRLNTYVHVTDDNGVAHAFGPDDDLPPWVASKITNESVWASDDDDKSPNRPGRKPEKTSRDFARQSPADRPVTK